MLFDFAEAGVLPLNSSVARYIGRLLLHVRLKCSLRVCAVGTKGASEKSPNGFTKVDSRRPGKSHPKKSPPKGDQILEAGALGPGPP